MSAPKSVIHNCLRAVAPPVLKKLAMENFTRMRGPYTHEDYVERCGTLNRATTIIAMVGLKDLIEIGKVLKLDVENLNEDVAQGKVLIHLMHYNELRSGKISAKQVYATIKNGWKPEKIRQAFIVKRELFGEDSLSKGDFVAYRLSILIELLRAKTMDAGWCFAYISDEYPEPLSEHLKLVGCGEVASGLNDWYNRFFPGLTGEALEKKGELLSATSLDDPKHRKEWRTYWDGVGAQVEAKTIEYLLANPDLF